MARGNPGIVSGIIGGGIAATGLSLSRDSTVDNQIGDTLAIVLVGFGVSIVVIGLVVQLRSPGKPTNKINIRKANKYHPTQRVALARVVLGIGAALVGGYGLFYTELPYAYPGVVTLAGSILFGRGLHRYWANSLMTYYIDKHSNKVFKGYRLIGRKSSNPEASKFVDVNIHISPVEQLLGVGDVIVELDGDNTVYFRDINSFQQFDDEVEELRESAK